MIWNHNKASGEDLHMQHHQYKTQEMCDAAVREDSLSLQFVPDWFVTQQEVKIWHHCKDGDDDDDDDDKLIMW